MVADQRALATTVGEDGDSTVSPGPLCLRRRRVGQSHRHGQEFVFAFDNGDAQFARGRPKRLVGTGHGSRVGGCRLPPTDPCAPL